MCWWRKGFINQNLRNWCHEQGIEIQITVPCSPSQNGVAECMNRTLVELSQAMLTAHHLPEFLWEYTVLHAAYICNHSHTRSLPKTPYEIWSIKKPNVSSYENLVLRFGYCCKDKPSNGKCYLSLSNDTMLAMMMDQNLSNIIMLTQREYLPLEISIS